LALAQGGLLSRNPETGKYRLGVDLIGLAAQVASYIDIREVARPILRELVQNCQETANLSVLDAGQVVNLEQFIPPNYQVKNIGWVGRRMDLHASAAGRVLLAYMPEDRIERHVHARLERYTPATMTDPDALRQSLRVIRERGFAVVEEELEAGLNVIAAPVFDHKGQAVAAVSIAGPAYRVTPAVFHELAGQLRQSADAISRRLGYRGGDSTASDNE